MHNDWHLQRSRGFLDALIDIGRDLKKCDIDHTAFDSDGSRQAIIKCVEKRLGKPSEVHTDTVPPPYNNYYKTHKGEKWIEGRLAGYSHTLRSLCYIDCGAGSARALIKIGSRFEYYYGVENALEDGGMEALVDTIHDTIGSPPDENEAYDYGYINMMRFIEHLGCLNGF